MPLTERLVCGSCGRVAPLYDDGIKEVIPIVDPRTSVEFLRCRNCINVPRKPSEITKFVLKLRPTP